jgi:hypothetical protein
VQPVAEAVATEAAPEPGTAAKGAPLSSSTRDHKGESRRGHRPRDVVDRLQRGSFTDQGLTDWFRRRWPRRACPRAARPTAFANAA